MSQGHVRLLTAPRHREDWRSLGSTTKNTTPITMAPKLPPKDAYSHSRADASIRRLHSAQDDGRRARGANLDGAMRRGLLQSRHGPRIDAYEHPPHRRTRSYPCQGADEDERTADPHRCPTASTRSATSRRRSSTRRSCRTRAPLWAMRGGRASRTATSRKARELREDIKRKVKEAGLWAPHLPVEYGGAGLELPRARLHERGAGLRRPAPPRSSASSRRTPATRRSS